MDRSAAILTVRTVWQELASLGQEACQEASKAKECLDRLESKDHVLTGREIKLIVEEVAGLMKSVREHDLAERMPHEKKPTPPKKYDFH